MFYRIKQPETAEEFKQYYYLRWKCLRAPWKQPEGSESDKMESACIHFIAIDDNKKVIAVARLQFNANCVAQIRYMAVASSHQKQGIGRALVSAIELRARENTANNMVLDARESAVDFYKKLGYRVVAKSYLLFNEIQHFHMSKSL